MKKGLLLAVVASMLVSANVSFAGFGVPAGVPGGSKPAASSSAKVDVGALMTSCSPVADALGAAYCKVFDARNVFEALIKKVDPKVLELQKSLKDGDTESKMKACGQAQSILGKETKKPQNFINELKKANVEQAKVDSAFATSKGYLQESYKLVAVGAVGVPQLLKDATSALKSLKPTDSNFGKVKAVVDVCQIASKYASAVGAYEKVLAQYKDFKSGKSKKK